MRKRSSLDTNRGCGTGDWPVMRYAARVENIMVVTSNHDQGIAEFHSRYGARHVEATAPKTGSCQSTGGRSLLLTRLAQSLSVSFHVYHVPF